MTDSLLDALLAKPVGPTTPARQVNPDKDFTRRVEVKGDTAEVEVRTDTPEADDNDTARAALADHGLDPEQWEVVGFRSSEWTMASGVQGVSKRFSFARKGSASSSERPPLDDLLPAIKRHKAKATRPQGEHGFIIALGDMQFGKIDGDGVAGTLQRTIDCLDMAADLVQVYRKRFDIGHVHVAWLGDHIEGFVSQGGANAWRTQLTLNEQIRLTRRVMTHGLLNFVDLAETVTMAAVPGNHGEPQRFAGKGLTRYDDSHDTESLIAVSELASYSPEKFGHVKFYVPETDEMTVVLPVAGTVVAHAHGHQWTPGKHFQWWEGQAFHNPGLHQADLMLAGHLHHDFLEASGKRLFLQPSSMEQESTWYRHRKGVRGNAGLAVAITKDGVTSPIEYVR